jgi:hypothetical protein
MMKKILFPAIALLAVVCLLPAASERPENPSWVNDLIAHFSAQPVGNPPQSIYRCEYKNQTVYYVPAQCCDQFSALYDAEGKVICAPDGGFTGGGDGRCKDFGKESKNKVLIWKDSRTGR